MEFKVNTLLEKATCRITVKKGVTQQIGTAWLCSDCYLITVGHLFLPDSGVLEGDSDDYTITLKFTADDNEQSARIVYVRRDDDLLIDFAVLRLDACISCTGLPIYLVDYMEGKVRISGVGQNFDKFSSSIGTIESRVVLSNGSFYFKIDAKNAGQYGYSGSSVYSEELNSVVGIQTEMSTITHGADRDTVFVMPIFRMVELYPKLKEYINISVLKYSASNMMSMSKVYRDKRQGENSLFFEDRIDTRILPNARLSDSPMPKLNEAILSTLQRLNGDSCFILGEEGGSGKTVTLIKYLNMKLTLETATEVPIYIELKNIPREIEKFAKKLGSIFAYYIACELYGYEYSTVPNSDISDIMKELINPVNKTRYILLVDGLNEVILENRSIICNEILFWSQYASIQVIVTSRYYEDSVIESKKHESSLFDDEEDDFIDSKKLRLIKIRDLDKDVIFDYLQKSGFKENILHQIESNTTLIKILSIPMFLIFFSRLSEENFTSGISLVCTRGEILHAFFKEKHDTLEIENQRSKLRRKDNSTKAIIELKQQLFVLDLIIPYIANYMVENQIYFIEREDLLQILSLLFDENSFMLHRARKIDRYRTLRDILNNWGRGLYQVEDCVDNIIDFITKELCIMKKSVKSHIDHYEFLHEHLRDYFATRQMVEDIKCYVAMGGNLRSIAHKNIPQIVIEFLGEITREHNCRPFCDETNEQWIYPGDSFIYNLLSMLKGKHDEDSKFAISNIVKILKYSRKNDLSGLDLSELDFSQSWLGGIRFYQWYNSNFYPSIFDGSTIDIKNMIAIGHSCTVTQIIRASYDTLFSADTSGLLKIWNTINMSCEDIKIDSEPIRKLLLDEINDILYISSAHIIFSLHLRDKSIKVIMRTQEHIKDLCFNDDGELNYCNDADLSVWRDLRGIANCKKLPMMTPAAAVAITSDGKKVIISARSRAHRLLLYCANENGSWQNVPTTDIGFPFGKRINSLVLSDDEKRVLVTIGNHLYEFSIESNEFKELLHIKTSGACQFATYYFDELKEAESIIFSDDSTIKSVDNKKEILWELMGNSNNCYLSFSLLPSELYMRNKKRKYAQDSARYLLVTRNDIQEFIAESNTCSKIYNKSGIGVCMPCYRLSDNRLYILTNRNQELCCHNGQLRFPVPQDYKLIDVAQSNENASFHILKMSNKIVVFDKINGDSEEFNVYEGLLIQNCSMVNIKGELATPKYQRILKRYGAKT